MPGNPAPVPISKTFLLSKLIYLARNNESKKCFSIICFSSVIAVKLNFSFQDINNDEYC